MKKLKVGDVVKFWDYPEPRILKIESIEHKDTNTVILRGVSYADRRKN